MLLTTYAPDTDMTFILDDQEDSVSVVGFYYGKPERSLTEAYVGKLKAEFSEPSVHNCVQIEGER